MKFTWKIGTAFGIGVFIHATFPLMVLWVAWVFYQQGGTLSAALSGVLLILSVFTIVVLHEFGHALTARRYGIATRDIILLPIGGVARLEKMPEEPRQELIIAVAGPAVNVVLAALLYVLLKWIGAPADMSMRMGSLTGYLNSLLMVNVYLVLFNALPAFPMDGGRVLRSVLAMRMEYSRATQIAAAFGKAFAVLFGIIGAFVVVNPFLILIAFFIWMGATAEANMARFKHDVGAVNSGSVLIRDVLTLSPDEPLTRGIEGVLAGFQQDFPVLQNGLLVGLLTREDLLKGLHLRGQESMVRESMRTSFPVTSATEGIDQVFATLQGAGLRTIPVVVNGEFIGVVTTENIAEFLMVQSALRRQL